ncbi:STAS domain-containing protein [Rhodococcus chondri]|uniref:Anti-sigma factor antagonist n=1 Tax=Rhodococcus chondri TaxID=3065941 RepID=A0ABU7JPL4_9NOCA|nr:STAS domain-containing protein [Rhodococcus sp. CC-R104]MEE2031973.1 STAS domain-containing protein [Rhodococcus sp. CC-R104]
MDSRPSAFGAPDPALAALVDLHACAPAALSITVEERTGPAAVLHVSGDIDITTTPELTERLTEVVSRKRDLVLDLREVGFLGCSGLQLFETAAFRLRHDGACAVAVTGPHTERALHISGVDRLIQCYCTLDAALHAVRSGPMHRTVRVHAPALHQDAYSARSSDSAG